MTCILFVDSFSERNVFIFLGSDCMLVFHKNSCGSYGNQGPEARTDQNSKLSCVSEMVYFYFSWMDGAVCNKRE